ncbi:hypothetical protein ACOMHN_012883 [Nucella lapillus]
MSFMGNGTDIAERSDTHSKNMYLRLIGAVKTIALTLPSVLLFIHCLHYITAQKLLPVITITPKTLKLKSLNANHNRVVVVRCSTGISNVGKVASIKTLRISFKGEDPSAADENTILATEQDRKAKLQDSFLNARDDKDKYSVGGSLLGAQGTSEITLSIRKANCDDAGRYRCTMNYVPKTGKGGADEWSVDGFIDVAPFSFNVSRFPNTLPIKVGDTFTLSCTAVVGTLANDQLVKKSQLQWVYRSRESAIENVYSELEQTLQKQTQFRVIEKVRCSERQIVTMKLTVHEARDSLRDYFCVASRFKDGNRISYVGGGLNTNVSMPSYEKAKKTDLGVGGFVGIGLGSLALLAGTTFGMIWCLRRKKKKEARLKEIEGRKSLIDTRRKSITTMVEKRKSIVPDGESTKAESSVAESSVAESSVAESSAVEPSTTEAESTVAG